MKFKLNLAQKINMLKEIFTGKKITHQPDWRLLGIIIFLVLYGLVTLASSGVALGWEKFHDTYWYVKHQMLYGLLPGAILFFFLYNYDYHKLKRWATALLFISIGLLVLVFIPGIGAPWGTSHSWIKVLGFSIQPAEIVKLTFLLYLSAWLSLRESHHLKNFNSGFLPFIVVLGIIAILMLLEPDTGTMMIIALTALIVFFTAGGSMWHLSWLAGVGGVGLWFLIKFSPYRAARLTTFLHPELDPLGIGYHINQALLAVGSGGWFGRGYGHSRQKFAYLPEVAGDSIFAVSAEEMGFIVSAIIILVFSYLALRGLKLAKRCEDPFGKHLVVGIITWFVLQAFFNVGAILGIMPLTGVPLPFISYGGTAMMICLAAVGILGNISKQHKID